MRKINATLSNASNVSHSCATAVKELHPKHKTDIQYDK
jgi:hypothetical protein